MRLKSESIPAEGKTCARSHLGSQRPRCHKQKGKADCPETPPHDRDVRLGLRRSLIVWNDRDDDSRKEMVMRQGVEN